MHNNYLFIATILMLLITLLHVAVIIGGASWYRFFGAGEKMARLHENASLYPILITVFVTALLLIGTLYTYCAYSNVCILLYSKEVLIVMSVIFISRGLFFIPLMLSVSHPYCKELKEKKLFLFISSLISLVVGSIYMMGIIN